LVARKKFAHKLAIILAALLAWPPCVPLQAIEPVGGEFSGATTRVAGSGPVLLNRDPNSVLDQGSWSEPTENFEDSDGRLELLFTPWAISHEPLDLPSLVPSALAASRKFVSRR
jgi:hypothetical protein